MKFSPIVVVFLALVLSSAAQADSFTCAEFQNGDWMCAKKGMFASGNNDRTEILFKGAEVTFFHHDNQCLWTGDYKHFKAESLRIRDKMLAEQGMTEADLAALSKHRPEGSRKVRKIDPMVIAGRRVPCYETGEHGERHICPSTWLYNLMKEAAGADLHKRLESVDMENMGVPKNLTEQAEDDLLRNAIAVYQRDFFADLGVHPVALKAMGDQAKKLADDAKQQAKEGGGPMPDTLLLRVGKKSKEVGHRYRKYKSLQAFFESGMRGGAGGDMGAGDMPSTTGEGMNLEGLNLEGILQQKGVTDTQTTPTDKEKKEMNKDEKEQGKGEETFMQKMKRIAKEKKEQLLKKKQE